MKLFKSMQELKVFKMKVFKSRQELKVFKSRQELKLIQNSKTMNRETMNNNRQKSLKVKLNYLLMKRLKLEPTVRGSVDRQE